MNDFGLYVIITKPVLPYRRIAEICVARGIKMLQLREKQLNDREILEAAVEITSVTDGTDTNFVMNDRADLAIISGADFLHLGQSDITVKEARNLIGPRPIRIGLSTHSLQQAREAIAQQPDYIGFGPIYPTPTKIIADPPVGTENLRKLLEFAECPVVAIGGIDNNTLGAVLGAGAKSPCLVRYLMESPDLEQRIAEIQSRL